MRIEDFTLENYESGELFNKVPHFELLKKIVENDSVHNNDSVYNHTLNVARNVIETAADSLLFSEYFRRKVKYNTILDLVTAAALFHDIGKASTYTVSDGVSSCEGHEEVSYQIADKYFKNVEGDAEEKDIIIEIVRQHAVFYPFLEPDNINIEKDFMNAEKKLALYPELLLFCLADIRGSQLKDNDLQLYLFKDSFLLEKLENYLKGASAG